MKIIDDETVRELYPMAEAIDVMRGALREFSAGQVSQPLRTILRGPDGDAFAVMPAHAGGTFGLKAISIKPSNAALGLDPHPGLVLVLDPDTALPVAIVDGTTVTAIRTAAASAAATAALARPDAAVLAILGSGAQARAHLEAVALVRDLREVRVWSRTPERARALVAAAPSAMGAPVVSHAATVTEAVAGADIVCTTTASAEPLLASEHVGPGAHINAVGAVLPDRRELASDLVERARIFVDSRESALAEAGDLLLAIREGRFEPSDIRAEVGEVLLGRRPGRTADVEVTVFESLGLAVQDVLSAQYLYERAQALGVGQTARLARTRTPATA